MTREEDQTRAVLFIATVSEAQGPETTITANRAAAVSTPYPSNFSRPSSQLFSNQPLTVRPSVRQLCMEFSLSSAQYSHSRNTASRTPGSPGDTHIIGGAMPMSHKPIDAVNY